VRDAIRRLERELLALRRRLEDEPEGLPDGVSRGLRVRAGESWYALPIDSVREVLQMLWPEPVAEAPPWVLGTFRFGDDVVPLIDVAQRLEGRRSALSPSMSVVLVEAPALVGLAFHEVAGLIELDPAEVVPPRPGISQAPFLLGSLTTGDEEHGIRLLSALRLSREWIFETVGAPGD